MRTVQFSKPPALDLSLPSLRNHIIMKLVLLCAIIIISYGHCGNDLSQWRTSYPSGEGSSSRKESYFSKLRLFEKRPQSTTTSTQPRRKYDYSSNSDCECGLTNSLSGRIVNGTETRPNEYPWVGKMVARNQMSGCSLITMIHAVAAAHATKGLEPREILLSFGRHDNSKVLEPTSSGYMVARILQHKDFKNNIEKRSKNDKLGFGLFNDISILVTIKEIVFTPYISPVCLPSHEFNLEGKEIKAMGWGDTKGTADRPDLLQQVDLAVFPFSSCMAPWGIIKDTKTQICATGHQKDTCHGDSGGGLVYRNPENEMYTLMGVVSYGDENCTAQKPSVNTYVYAYMEWIIGQVSKDKRKAKICTGD